MRTIRTSLLALLMITGAATGARSQSDSAAGCLERVRAAYARTAESFSHNAPYRFHCRYRAEQRSGGRVDTVDTHLELASRRGVTRYSVGTMAMVRDSFSLFVHYAEEKLIYRLRFDSAQGDGADLVTAFRQTLFDHVTDVECRDTIGRGREKLTIVTALLDSAAAPIYGVRRLTCLLTDGTNELRSLTMEYLPGRRYRLITLSDIAVDYDDPQSFLPPTAAELFFTRDGALLPAYDGYQVIDSRLPSLTDNN